MFKETAVTFFIGACVLLGLALFIGFLAALLAVAFGDIPSPMWVRVTLAVVFLGAVTFGVGRAFR